MSNTELCARLATMAGWKLADGGLWVSPENFYEVVALLAPPNFDEHWPAFAWLCTTLGVVAYIGGDLELLRWVGDELVPIVMYSDCPYADALLRACELIEQYCQPGTA